MQRMMPTKGCRKRSIATAHRRYRVRHYTIPLPPQPLTLYDTPSFAGVHCVQATTGCPFPPPAATFRRPLLRSSGLCWRVLRRQPYVLVLVVPLVLVRRLWPMCVLEMRTSKMAAVPFSTLPWRNGRTELGVRLRVACCVTCKRSDADMQTFYKLLPASQPRSHEHRGPKHREVTGLWPWQLHTFRLQCNSVWTRTDLCRSPRPQRAS